MSCNKGRRKTSKPENTGLSEEGRDGVREGWDGVDEFQEIKDGVDGGTKTEADGERNEEGWDEASATTFF